MWHSARLPDLGNLQYPFKRIDCLAGQVENTGIASLAIGDSTANATLTINQSTNTQFGGRFTQDRNECGFRRQARCWNPYFNRPGEQLQRRPDR
jgi:hypothetical protein